MNEETKEEIIVEYWKIKHALEKSREALTGIIDNVETNDLNEYDIVTIKAYLNAPSNRECHCDEYNGFDCGCSAYSFAVQEAMKEIDKCEKLI